MQNALRRWPLIHQVLVITYLTTQARRHRLTYHCVSLRVPFEK